MVTIWTPDVSTLNGPAYQRLANAIARDIDDGQLKPGDRLPPQRELAESLGTTLGTVTRGYQLAARRGLVTGEVGRGTYVLGGDSDDERGEPLDLSLNALPPHPFRAALEARLDGSVAGPRAGLLDYPPREGRDAHRQSGAAWIGRRGLVVDPSQVMVTVGAQHALLVAMSATTRPGDAVLVEEFTYGGVLGAARMLGLQPVPVAIDTMGLRVDALDAACRTSSARVLVIQPALHNPTGVTMTSDRRREVLAVAAREGLTVIEDDTYGFLVPGERPMVIETSGPWAYVTGLSKSLAGGYRTGFLAVSPDLVDRAQSTLWASAIAASPISAALAISLIDDGTADEIVEWKRREARARLRLAREVLPQVPEATSAGSPHLWLPLPRPWRAGTFAEAARVRGILLGATEGFLANPAATPRAIRVCLMPPRSRDRLRDALRELADLAARVPDPQHTV